VTAVPRRLAALFLLAVTGVLVAVGLVVGAQLVKRQARVAAIQAGRTCTCCTGSVHDPVQVI
jgi:Na+-driven multidrug efflux pump